MSNDDAPDPEDVDPNADRCPVCGKRRTWRGQHAAKKHPEWWSRFKKVYKPEEVVTTKWVPRD